MVDISSKFVTFIFVDKEAGDINSEFVEIMHRLNKLHVEIPTTTDKAVNKAIEALKCKEEYMFSDEEIDMFLPLMLRGGINENTSHSGTVS